ncbi:MAG TPA: chloride channel protein, partial [Myxococcaceae bacterium]
MAFSTQLRAWQRDAVRRLLAAVQRLRLPGPSVLPVAGAVVGVYSGLAAGLFSNLIALVSGLSVGFPLLVELLRAGSQARLRLAEALTGARWHFEFIIVGVPLGLAALGLAYLI